MEAVLKVAEGWILSMEIRISEYKTIIQCIKILKPQNDDGENKCELREEMM